MEWQDDGAHTDAVRLVTKRLDFLERLTDSPLTKRELVDELTYSRSTVDRAVRDLEVAGLLDHTDAGYETTLSGRISAEQYRHFVRTANDTIAIRDVVDELPPDAPVDGRMFRGSTVHRADEAAPHSLVDTLIENLEDATWLRALSDSVPHPQSLNAVFERVERGQLFVEGVVSESLWRALLEHHPDSTERMLDIGMAVKVGTVPPFTLHLVEGDETFVQLLVHDEVGSLRGIVVNETAEAVEWATTLFERMSADADSPHDGSEN